MEIIAAILGGTAVSGILAVLVFKLVSRSSSLADRLITAAGDKAAATVALAQRDAGITERDTALAQVKQQCDSLTHALATAEQHRDELLHALASAGDPGAVAAGIRDQLRKLSNLSGAVAPAAAEGGGSPALVHVSRPDVGTP